MSLDTSFYYRLTNDFQGAGFALDVKADGSGRLMMAPDADYSGQYWRFVDLGGGKYALRTLYLGDCFSLDVINDSAKETPWLNATGNFSGQSWSLTPWGDGRTVKLTNDFTGPERSLNVFAESFEPFVGGGDHSGQHWTLTSLREIPDNVFIPQTGVSRTDEIQTEGPTNYVIFAIPQGTVRAVLIFVDFADAPGSAWPTAVAAQVLQSGGLQKLFHDQSYGRLTLEVDVRADLGWKRMPKPSSSPDYDFSTNAPSGTRFPHQKAYITDAASLFDSQVVKLGDYKFVFIVPPKTAAIPISPAFNTWIGNGAPTASGEIRLAVTLGNDIYTNRYITLVHETTHLFGLPDLYWHFAEDSKAGSWDIMSDTFRAGSFLGWHRHKLGWLDLSRELYISQPTSGWYTTLSPLSGGCGLSMVALPIDDAAKPSKLFVVELAQPVLGRTDSQPRGDGVLIYTVDVNVKSLESPVEILAKTTGFDSEYGNLYQAPFGVGDRASFTVGSAHLTVDVIQKFGSSYNIKIGYR